MEVLGVSLRSYFVQYRFILPDSIKHSSYTYQKLFRAIYGYTQAVNKGSGKTYKYHRAGILSNYPYIRPGKNCVIIPQPAFQSLQEFFKTGRNPTHLWQEKGEWKCTYFLNEKDLSEKEVVLALENLLARKYLSGLEGPARVDAELKRATEKGVDEGYKQALLKEAQQIVEFDWFKSTYSFSPVLSEFYSNYRFLKGGTNQTIPSQQAQN
jgi:hypothetical protein